MLGLDRLRGVLLRPCKRFNGAPHSPTHPTDRQPSKKRRTAPGPLPTAAPFDPLWLDARLQVRCVGWETALGRVAAGQVG